MTAPGIVCTSAVNFPINHKQKAVTAAPPITHTEATLVKPITPVFSPYVVLAGPPMNPAQNVATPSPISVRCNPGLFVKSRPTIDPKTK